MRIVAIDPGTLRAGYAVFELNGRGPVLVGHEQISVMGKNLPLRLLCLHGKIEDVFRRERPREVVIERPFVGVNGRDALTLNAARAVCMLAAAAAGAQVYEYAPAEVKRTVTGSGQAPKERVQRMVRLILRLPEAPEPDVADAMALALCHANRL